MAPGEACTVPPPPAYSRTVPALPTSLHTRPKRRRGKTRFRKTGLSANRSPAERRSRLAANRRVVLLGPFGEPLTNPTGLAAEMPFRFSTHYTDGETGLIYAKHRYYDPITGRWLSRDPIAEEGGMNLYSFVRNDSLNFVDPFGENLYAGIYYDNPARDVARSFYRAALTWKKEVESRFDYTTCDSVILFGVKTVPDFVSAWQSIAREADALSTKVKEVTVFTHGQPENFSFAPDPTHPKGTLTTPNTKNLPVLPWTQDALLDLRSCRSGRGGLCYQLNRSQNVAVSAQSGFAYFSESPNTWIEIDKAGSGTSTEVYLKAYERPFGRNQMLDWDGRGWHYPYVGGGEPMSPVFYSK